MKLLLLAFAFLSLDAHAATYGPICREVSETGYSPAGTLTSFTLQDGKFAELENTNEDIDVFYTIDTITSPRLFQKMVNLTEKYQENGDNNDLVVCIDQFEVEVHSDRGGSGYMVAHNFDDSTDVKSVSKGALIVQLCGDENLTESIYQPRVCTFRVKGREDTVISIQSQSKISYYIIVSKSKAASGFENWTGYEFSPNTQDNRLFVPDSATTPSKATEAFFHFNAAIRQIKGQLFTINLKNSAVF